MALFNQDKLEVNGKTPIFGLVRGRVENNIDPMKIGRVQVRIPKLHGVVGESNSYLAIDDLPWAYPCNMGSGFEHGSCIVPEIGDYVFIAFESGDPDCPVYIGGCYGVGATTSKPYGVIDDNNASKSDNFLGGKGYQSWCDTPETPSEVYGFSSAPTGKVLYRSLKGSSIFVNDTDGQESINLYDISGQGIKIVTPVNPESSVGNAARRRGNTNVIDAPDDFRSPEYLNTPLESPTSIQSPSKVLVDAPVEQPSENTRDGNQEEQPPKVTNTEVRQDTGEYNDGDNTVKDATVSPSEIIIQGHNGTKITLSSSGEGTGVVNIASGENNTNVYLNNNSVVVNSGTGAVITINRDGTITLDSATSVTVRTPSLVAKTNNMDLDATDFVKVHAVNRIDLLCDDTVNIDSAKTVNIHSSDVMTVESANSLSVKSPTTSYESDDHSITTGTLTISGQVSISGDVSVDGNINATGSIMDAGGNSNHHRH